MQDFRDSQTSDGLVGMIAPRAGVEEDLVWSCAYLFIPWEQYCHYGDRQILAEHYPSFVRYLEFLGKQGAAEISPRPIGTDPLREMVRKDGDFKGHLQRSQWGDHLSLDEGFHGRSGLPFSISTAFYYKIACVMRQIADVLKMADDVDRFARLAEEIKLAFHAKFFNPTTRFYDDGSQAAQAFALDFDLVPDAFHDAVLRRLLNDLAERDWHLTTGYPGTKSLIHALTSNGRADIVWNLANQTGFPSWQDMIKGGRTTLNEHWDPTQGSHNHVALGAHLDAWFFTSLAGIQIDPIVPGYERIVFNPYIPSDLDYAAATIHTMRGPIKSSWRKENGRVRYHFSIPANSSALAYIPFIDGSSILESGKSPLEAVGVRYLDTEKGRSVFELHSGNYEFHYIGELHSDYLSAKL